MSKRKVIPEKAYGRYTPMPHDVLDSIAFTGCSVRAKAMLFELLRQHTSRNNGHLQLTFPWLKRRGWKSADQIQKAKTELISRGLILKTKLGGLSIGPDWYALTWLDITDFSGLDIRPKEYHRGQWQLMDKLPLQERRPHTEIRSLTVPQKGMGSLTSVPPDGSLEGVLNQSSRIVGKARKAAPNIEGMH